MILPIYKAGDFQIPCFFYRYGFPFRFTGFQRCKKGVNFKSNTLNPLVFRAFQDSFSILPWQIKSTLIILIKPRIFKAFQSFLLCSPNITFLWGFKSFNSSTPSIPHDITSPAPTVSIRKGILSGTSYA